MKVMKRGYAIILSFSVSFAFFLSANEMIVYAEEISTEISSQTIEQQEKIKNIRQPQDMAPVTINESEELIEIDKNEMISNIMEHSFEGNLDSNVQFNSNSKESFLYNLNRSRD